MRTKTEKRLLIFCIILAAAAVILALALIFFNPNEVVPNKDKFTVRENQDWVEVTPTDEELDQIPEKLDAILGTHFRDYDCTKDNAYENSFNANHLRSIIPLHESEIEQFVAQPLDYYDTGSDSFPLWRIFVPQNDPLGKFPKIHESVFNQNGGTDESKAFELVDKYHWFEIVIGYNKFSAPYIDWVITGVWNGKAEHDALMEFEDYTQLYYHDGFYYTPEFVGDYGGDGYDTPVIDVVAALGDGRYEIKYHFDNYMSDSCECRAIVGLKESKDGFRFWSIYSIDYDI